MKCSILGLLLFLSFSTTTCSQEKDVNIGFKFLSNETIGEINFDKEPLAKYMSDVVDKLEYEFDSYTDVYDIEVLFTFHVNNNPSIRIFSKPTLEKKEQKKLLKELKLIKLVKSIFDSV